jgi:acylphosphatase
MVVELHDRFRPGCTDALNAAIGSGFVSVREDGDIRVLVNASQRIGLEVVQ